VGSRRIKVGEVKSREDAPGYFKDRGFEVVSFALDPDGNDAADIAVSMGNDLDCYSIEKKVMKTKQQQIETQKKCWVIVATGDKIKVWRNYDIMHTWAGPFVTVLGYAHGSYRDAQRKAKELRR
jgi:hypothetical protein